MLNRKMDAVKCIVNKSEEFAEAFHRSKAMQDDFQYYSSKYSLVNVNDSAVKGNCHHFSLLAGQQFNTIRS